MKILLNNREEELNGDTISVTGLLLEKKLSFRMRIVKINGHLVPKDRYNTTVITGGDSVQVLYLMSGG